MEFGPTLSEILDLLNKGSKDPAWAAHISGADPETHMVDLLAPAKTDRLTKRELNSLEKAYSQLRGMTFGQLSNYCHDKFTEWHNPGKKTLAIKYEDILAAVGRDGDFVQAIRDQQEVKRNIQSVA